MPPPTANDAWLAARRFGVVIDAGSSGSRLQVYSWRDARVVREEEGPSSYRSLPRVAKGAKNSDDWMLKVEPGISSFASNPSGVAGHLAPLLAHARDLIPPSLHVETPLFLLATAGMRLLDPAQQTEILDTACHFLRFHSHFRLDKRTPAGLCGSSVRIITGEEEGLFGWIAVNYLMDEFTQRDDRRTTYGFLDMGGASTQIAFEPSEEEQQKTMRLSNVRLRLIGGEEIQHNVFVTTWLGYGTNQARERYVAEAIAHYERLHASHGISTSHGPISDPCLPRDLVLSEVSAYPGHDNAHSQNAHTLVGTGSFEQCLNHVAPLLNKDAPCPQEPCLFNGIHVPHIDFSASHFIGISEYWYSSEHVFGLGGPYNVIEYERAASEFCSRHWDDIMKQHELSKAQGHMGGDGEDEDGGQVIRTGVWGDKVEIPRLQMQCFKSAWLINILHDGIGLPRIVDRGGNYTGDAGHLDEMAAQKGLGRPTMQTMDMIDDTAISWTLGKMVLEASREVPPLSDAATPLSDPIVNPDNRRADPQHNATEYDSLDDIWSPTGGQVSLGISPFGVIFYAVCFSIAFICAYRLRRQLVKATRTILWGAVKRGADSSTDHLGLEDGLALDSARFIVMPSSASSQPPASPQASRPWAAMRSQLTRLVSLIGARPLANTSPSAYKMRHMHTASARPAPLRSSSSPSLKYQNGSGNNQHAGALYPTSFPSRSSSPPVLHFDSTLPNGHTNQTLYSLPRSRNNSQMNLTTLVPRQPLSRGGSSGQQTPTGSSFHGD